MLLSRVWNGLQTQGIEKFVIFRQRVATIRCKQYATTTVPDTKNHLDINGHLYQTDEWTNVTPKILSYLNLNKHLQRHHPLSILRQRIVNYFYGAYRNQRGNPLFSVYDNLNPVVTTQQNFDNLLIPPDHVSRNKSDCYYINGTHLLRAHTTAHQFDLISSGLDNFLVVGDVYRRDEIDSTHYPVFHQLDAVRLVTRDKLFESNPELDLFDKSANIGNSNESDSIMYSSSKCIDQAKQTCHSIEAVKVMEHELKTVLVGLAKDLFGQHLKYQWVDTQFPFTQPSWELEIYHDDKWLEVLGCGIMRNEILQHAGVQNSIGYAFGLGLERLAMVLFNIPDIRLFWSNDTGFLSQFNETNLNNLPKYKPISVFPQCKNDLSFWLPDQVDLGSGFEVNDFYDLVRTVAGDMVEQIQLVDHFKNPKTKKSSLCFRIIYRNMERTLTQAEVNKIHQQIANECVKQFNVKVR